MGVWAYFCVCALFAQALAAAPPQIPIQAQPWDGNVEGSLPSATKKRALQGRFLHITDFHPDRFYEIYSSTSKEEVCHSGQGPAGIYGAETSDCDSPIDLINKTMKWIEKELKDKIDFVVWTGDSARHDNDEAYPRTDAQVTELNEFMVHKMAEVFGKHNGDEEDDDPNNDYIIPIIPNLGNNDILPHNIFRNGPNKWTRTYVKMWKSFIPEEQRHQFEQGGWFYVEVIPNKLAVFSLNTIYFFKSNAAVDGCASHSEPGYRQMEWLRIQLQFMRDRGMKAILIGHVPPAREESKTSWDETCWQKYTLWLRQYRDVITGSLYGHFNYDHFILHDFEDLRKGTKKGRMPDYGLDEIEYDGDVHTAVSSDYFTQLRNRWARLPQPPKRSHRSFGWLHKARRRVSELEVSKALACKFDKVIIDASKKKHKKRKKRKDKRRQEEKKYLKEMGGPYAERFAATFVSASIVPNLFPSLRVFEYNITGLDKKYGRDDAISSPALFEPSPHITRRKNAKAAKRRKYKFEVPEPPSKSSPPGPAYSPQTLSLVRYTQYLANLTHINNDFLGQHASEGDLDATKWREGKHKGKKPHSKEHEPSPKKFKFEVHYDTKHDDVYKLHDLTVPSMVDLARRIGNFEPEAAKAHEAARRKIDAEKKKHKKKHKQRKKHKHGHKGHNNDAWYAFLRRAYVETLSPDELEGFGE